MIEVSALSKIYRVRARQGTSVWQSFRALFSREYRELVALDAIDWQVRAAQVHGLIGQNGSGKSTLLKILCGILQPSAGSARVNGVVPWVDRRRYVQHIGVVFGQKSQLTWELPAIDSFELNRSLYRIPPVEFARTLELLRDAFAAVIDRPVRGLSLGERMKCEIICSLLHRPQLLFLDEPTIGLDLLAKDQVRRAIRKVNAELGTTIILTSHDLSDVSSVCDEISLLDRGKFLYRGPIGALVQAASSRKPMSIADSRVESLQLEQVLAAIYRGELDLSRARKALPAA